jgi:hypothetical protein
LRLNSRLSTKIMAYMSMGTKSMYLNIFGIFAAIVAPLVSAQGYDSVIRYDLAGPANLTPFATATTPDGGLWLMAPGDGDMHQLVRLDAAGNRSASVSVPSAVDSDNADRFAIYPLADGGVLELDTQRRSQIETYCILRSITKAGVIRFTRNVYQPRCTLKLADQGGAPYLLSNTDGATLLAEDGSLISSFPRADGSSLIRAEFVSGGRELLLLHTNDTRTGYLLSRALDRGSQLFSIPLANVRIDQNVTVRGLSDGRALVLVSDTPASGQAGVTKLQLRVYSALGNLTETRDIAMPDATQVGFGDWSQDAQGNQALALIFSADLTTSYGAILFGRNATVLKQFRYAPSDECKQRCPLLGLALGFANSLTTQTGTKLVLISVAQNVANTEIVLPGNFDVQIATGANASIIMSSPTEFRAFNSSGSTISVPSMLGKGMTQPRVVAASVAEDGKSYLLHQYYREESDFSRPARESVNRLEAFAAGGAKLWQRDVPDATAATLMSDRMRVCLSSESANAITFTCFSAATGAELARVAVPNASFQGLFPAKIRSRMLRDGRLRIVYVGPNSSVEIVDITSDNQIVRLTASVVGPKSIVDIGASGSVLLTAAAPTMANTIEVHALSPTGQLAFRRPSVAGEFNNATSGKILDNEEVLVVESRQNSAANLFDSTLLSPSGVVRWTISKPRVNAQDHVANLYVDAKNAYILRSDSRALRLDALAASNGNSVWQRAIKSDAFATTHLFASPAASELLLTLESRFGLQLQRIVSDSGALVEQRLLDCGAVECILRASTLDSAGTLRVISEANDAGRSAVTVGRADVRTTALTVPMDQLGLSGAWHAPQLGGQGFFIEYFPQSKLLFMPWFTYDVADDFSGGQPANSSSVSDLRWYTLSGVVEPGAKVARLEIRRNVSGVFNSVPITESALVGTATLRAQDCNRATLEYEFTSSEAEGQYGVMPLERLTGGSAPCQLSATQSTPGRDARAARGGFDGRQSGAWYQPQTSGQGLMITVQPATTAAAGFLFGGWFTYDAGTPNDATAQHWFSLAGEIPINAQAGVAQVTIYRTLGGQLASGATQNTVRLGEGSVTFSGFTSAVVRYQFDDALIAGSFRGRSGEINLQCLGACPEQ